MSSNFVKVVVTVPTVNSELIRQVIGEAGGGIIGDYTHCSFTTSGIGRFIPTNNANPTIGQIGKYEEVEEDRIEITVSRESLKAVLDAIRKHHPYEEIALDVYTLEDLNF